jgi:hypothetical protein
VIELLFCALLFLYFIPASVACRRAHHKAASIVILNLVLGWTLIGWVVALVWALTASPVEFYLAQNDNPLLVDDHLRRHRGVTLRR